MRVSYLLYPVQTRTLINILLIMPIKKYLVGGAVRDTLLGLTVTERDWLVVGSSPQELINQGFTQVGKQFPVFLHPETKEEYALARIESKQGHGYQGFKFDFNPAITLEQDLKRRDLTINAMAMNEKNQLSDPYGGFKDLNERTLRHVSQAFTEDPLRVMRTARFHARFFYLGFKIAEETMQLMHAMVASHELDHLSKERIWLEWQKAMLTNNPEVFFEDLKQLQALPMAIAALPTEPLARIARLTTEPDIRLTIYLAQLSDLSILAQLKMPNYLLRQIKQFKQEYLHLNIHMHHQAHTILELLKRTDAFRRTQEFINLLNCYSTLTEDTTNTKLWCTILEQMTQIKLPDSMLKEKNTAKIQNYFETKRLELITKVLNS